MADPSHRLAALSLLALVAGLAAAAGPPALAARFEGSVTSADGGPVVGAMVTFRRVDAAGGTAADAGGEGSLLHDLTVYSDESGSYRSPLLRDAARYTVRVRRLGWRDAWRRDAAATPADAPTRLDFALERETDPAALAAQLPANRWFGLLLEKLDDPRDREELVRQCTYCHQQGNAATRIERDDVEWQKVLALMARMGGILRPELRARVPELFRSAYAPEHAVPALTRGMDRPEFASAPPARVRRAIVEEWELGQRASMQHDLLVHPDGRIYSVDMTQDQLYRLDPRAPDGDRVAFDVPQGDLPLGGVFGSASTPMPPNARSRVGPHSLQVAPDGAIWSTLALGNQLARFDPATEAWEVHELEEGYYPHTLRFDAVGRIWYTVAVSNHIGMLDPATGTHRWIRLPARTWGQAIGLRLLPAFLWLNRHFDLGDMAASSGEGVQVPVPYGIDVAPDGSVWFSQLNEHRIGRIDPQSFEVELIDTPFTAPRRLRFDSHGRLWIPGFSSSLVSRFDPATREFVSFRLPIEPAGSETPYALNVDRRTGDVWICGTNSDTLIRFEPDAAGGSGRFSIYPLPTRVTYTREIDFDEQGRVWTSNSNLPSWQIEGGFPRVLRLDPRDVPERASAPTERPEDVAWQR